MAFELFLDALAHGGVGSGGFTGGRRRFTPPRQEAAQEPPHDPQSDQRDDDGAEPRRAAESLVPGGAQNAGAEAFLEAGDDFFLGLALSQPASDVIAENLRLTAAAGSQ